MLGIPALGIVDRNSLAGIVRAHEAAKTTGVRLVVGCRLDLADGTRCWSIRPTGRLRAALPAAVARKGRAGKGAVPSRLGRSRALRRRPARDPRARRSR